MMKIITSSILILMTIIITFIIIVIGAPAHSPWQRTAVVEVEHLVGVEQLPEGGNELQALTSSRLHVDEDEERLHALGDHVGKDVRQQHH